MSAGPRTAAPPSRPVKLTLYSAALALAASPAAAQAEAAKPLIDRLATDATVAVIVLLFGCGGLGWNIRSMLTAHDEARKRHEVALGTALDRFIATIEKSAAATEQQAVALVSTRESIAELRYYREHFLRHQRPQPEQQQDGSR